jgi:hypothetical protein
MDIKPYTIKTRMQNTTLIRKALSWVGDLCAEYGVDENVLYTAYTDYAALSLRTNGSTFKGLDFKPLELTDSPEEAQKKFRAYLDTQCSARVFEIERAIQAYDAPADPALAPEPPTDPEA